MFIHSCHLAVTQQILVKHGVNKSIILVYMVTEASFNKRIQQVFTSLTSAPTFMDTVMDLEWT